ncbi:hypothetical protein AVEN_243265-1 [Araneus ventricosus]|uniref:Uncharacterized protein n=1 Tax=Araneus ventricosus TaxID=182803 RepID=A0A4Y2MA52_ARAVE|nr:hypothetical protein AVEN_243265-1 [Araneus ventricosus]
MSIMAQAIASEAIVDETERDNNYFSVASEVDRVWKEYWELSGIDSSYYTKEAREEIEAMLRDQRSDGTEKEAQPAHLDRSFTTTSRNANPSATTHPISGFLAFLGEQSTPNLFPSSPHTGVRQRTIYGPAVQMERCVFGPAGYPTLCSNSDRVFTLTTGFGVERTNLALAYRAFYKQNAYGAP